MEGANTFTFTLTDDAIDSDVLSDGAASYMQGAGGLIGETRGGTSKYYHADALGTTRAITNSSQTKTDSLDTDAFGMNVAVTGTTPTPFGFAGQHGYQNDSVTGLMRLGHRFYDASVGRFLSRDPIQDGYNWYAYVNNDPVNKVDPEGVNGVIINDGKNTVDVVVQIPKPDGKSIWIVIPLPPGKKTNPILDGEGVFIKGKDRDAYFHVRDPIHSWEFEYHVHDSVVDGFLVVPTDPEKWPRRSLKEAEKYKWIVDK